ncbi:MAG TPA: HAD-IIIC family phosphatase [Acidobacteriaceae bacterium]|nr:HAD-IIIC family phosphatase [Acidobacteriaceae bacterium]
MQAETAFREKREAVQSAAAAGSIKDLLHAVNELLALGLGTDVAFCATVFRKLGPALGSFGHRRLKTSIVRSVTVEPILPVLQVEAVLHGYVLELEVGGYGSYMDELLNPQGALGRSGADLVLVVLDAEDIAGQLPELCAAGRAEEIGSEIQNSVGRATQMLRGYRADSKGRLVVQGCVLPEATSLGAVGDANVSYSLVNAMREVNRQLAEACRSIPDCAFFDVDQVAARYGRGRWRDERMFLASRLAVAPGAFRPYAHGLMRTASALFRAPRKVLCTDLDNTLWGGVLGEDGPAGVATGAAFPGNAYLAYQRYLKELAARGILLAITSKNNPSDVAEAFGQRAADLALTLDDFVARKIGWNEKVDALRELAAELSLGLDSFVFVDDNPMECEAVRQHLPEVAVVEVPVSEPWRLVEMLSEQWYFDAATVTADDRHRSEEYRAQAQRAALSENATSREEFLGSLGIVCTFLSAAEAPLERSVQLLAKTNQFNLTTRRYSASEVMEFVDDPQCQAVAVRVRDRFGDAGVVGLALTRQKSDACWVDALLLSCRVIGRGIETAILAQLAEHAASMGARWLVGEFIETKKNAPCKEFYPEHGFTKDQALSVHGTEVYRLDLAVRLPESPSWLTLEGTENYELAASAVVPA